MNLSFRYLIAGILLTSSNFCLEARQLPVKVGKPIRISPVPGPANPDPIAQNLVSVLDNHYQLPFYPGGSPDYLSQIYILSNYYITNFLHCNPCNDNIMNVEVGQNILVDGTSTFTASIGSNTFATSLNRGRTWKYGPPVEQIIPLGGNISQVINSSLGPGLFLDYGKNGQLSATGWGFWDMVTNPPNANPQMGYLYTTSKDSGRNWAPRRIELASNVVTPFGPPRGGVGPREFGGTHDPSNPHVLDVASMFVLDTSATRYGNLFYNRSTDGGKTFSPLKQVYTLIDDPVWRSKFFDPTQTDPDYYAYGGWSLVANVPLKYDDNILFLPIVQLLNSSMVDENGNFFDATQALVRSLDNGKTWEKVAGSTAPYFFPETLFDPGFEFPFSGAIVKGVLSFPFFSDGTSQLNANLVSPVTGRTYLTYSAFNQAISNLDIGYFINKVLLSVSSDKGATFTPPVQINRTPTNILPGAQQAFSHGAAITKDGYYCVAYYDFRNWTGFPGEDIANTPLQTDAWLDVYKETEDPRGGSTGVGLDFVGEFRLTKESYNARIINLSTSTPYSTPYITGTPEGIPMLVNNNNELFVVYSAQSTEGVSPSNITTTYKGATLDTNGYITCFMQRFKFANVGNQ